MSAILYGNANSPQNLVDRHFKLQKESDFTIRLYSGQQYTLSTRLFVISPLDVDFYYSDADRLPGSEQSETVKTQVAAIIKGCAENCRRHLDAVKKQTHR
jgi:hypothetical protein